MSIIILLILAIIIAVLLWMLVSGIERLINKIWKIKKAGEGK